MCSFLMSKKLLQINYKVIKYHKQRVGLRKSIIFLYAFFGTIEYSLHHFYSTVTRNLPKFSYIKFKRVK